MSVVTILYIYIKKTFYVHVQKQKIGQNIVLCIFINWPSCNVDLRLWISIFFSQILEVNGQNFENVPLSKVNEILKNNTHLSITVKTNLLGKLHWRNLPQLHRQSFIPNTTLNLKIASQLSSCSRGKFSCSYF